MIIIILELKIDFFVFLVICSWLGPCMAFTVQWFANSGHRNLKQAFRKYHIHIVWTVVCRNTNTRNSFSFCNYGILFLYYKVRISPFEDKNDVTGVAVQQICINCQVSFCSNQSVCNDDALTVNLPLPPTWFETFVMSHVTSRMCVELIFVNLLSFGVSINNILLRYRYLDFANFYRQ